MLFFFQWKLLYFYSNSTVICSQGPVDNVSKLVQIVAWCLFSDNGLAPNRHQAIIWTNGGIIYWRIIVSLAVDHKYDLDLFENINN